ncbi:hypothetical protein OUZ56_016705 [Daphnia magna]|uniref:Uncharacterized protein n=1 Tax=Daphnia magna TaxID=35525 RepID=A0ABR0ARR6_9CRUS|nr:hypothetical protein OUZ56_016705 [Daphnia magna]
MYLLPFVDGGVKGPIKSIPTTSNGTFFDRQDGLIEVHHEVFSILVDEGKEPLKRAMVADDQKGFVKKVVTERFYGKDHCEGLFFTVA